MDPSAGSSQNQPNKKRPQRNRRPNWTPDQTTLMLNLMRQEQIEFRVAGPGTFNKHLWDRVAILISSQSTPARDGLEVYGRWKTIKSEFHDYKACVEKSGWTWHRDTYVPLAPEGAWEELKKKNSKLYKCKDKPFIWYPIMKEICGTNVASGYRAFDSKNGEPIEDLVSRSDSSDSNRTASHEVNDFNLHEFRNNMGVDLNLSFGEFDQDFPMVYSSEPVFGGTVGATSNTGSGSVSAASGAASGASSGKRSREGSLGIENDGQEKVRSGKKSKGDSRGKNKDPQYNPVDVIVQESRERRNTFEEMKNIMLELLAETSNKHVARKMFNVKSDKGLSMRDMLILQDLLKDKWVQEVFMTLEGAELDQWIVESIESYKK